jgi:hypothetical protein
MPRASHLQPSFNQGEWSPLTYGRADIQQRAKAMQLCREFIPQIQGPITRRGGTWYTAPAKVVKPRLQRFQFNTTQAYILEFGANYVRFFVNGGQLLSGGVPYEVATPYGINDIPGLNFTQSADVLYIVHPSYPPKTLSRLGATNWVLADMVFQDGPYQTQNTADNYLTCTVTRAGSTGTLTASNTNGINGGAGFQASTDVGRLMRIQDTNWTSTSTDHPVKWIQIRINSVTSTLVCNVTVIGIVPQ